MEHGCQGYARMLTELQSGSRDSPPSSVRSVFHSPLPAPIPPSEGHLARADGRPRGRAAQGGLDCARREARKNKRLQSGARGAQ